MHQRLDDLSTAEEISKRRHKRHDQAIASSEKSRLAAHAPFAPIAFISLHRRAAATTPESFAVIGADAGIGDDIAVAAQRDHGVTRR